MDLVVIMLVKANTWTSMIMTTKNIVCLMKCANKIFLLSIFSLLVTSKIVVRFGEIIPQESRS